MGIFESELDETGDIWVVPMDGSGKPYPFIETEFHEYNAQFSPDGRWVAYVSHETGRPEIYVVSFPKRGAKKQLTSIGAQGVMWLRNGRELRIVTADLTHLRIRVEGDTFGTPEVIGKVPENLVNGDISADGSRILSIQQEKLDPVPITLITNWTESLGTRRP
jgi:serine/threonine-protein kinase